MSKYIRDAAFCKLNLQLIEDDATKALASTLKLSIPEAAGIIGLLICLGISKATDNGVLDLKDKVIERECLWPGRRGQKTGQLIPAFKACGILRDCGDDVQICENVWANYAFDAIKKRKDGAKRQDAYRKRHKVQKLDEYRDFVK